MTNPINFMGSQGSPYTRKMLAVLRYRQIPYSIHWTNREVPEGFPKPKIGLLPTFFFPDEAGGFEAVTDSTPLIRRFEKEHEGRSVIPSHPVVGFLNDLIEDYGDEWLTKAMFHYRWGHEEDSKNAGPILMAWESSIMGDDEARSMSEQFTENQISRLYVVGSNSMTAPIIEAAYARFVGILNDLIKRRGFVFGARPSSADFALFGQMTQLAIVEPTSAKIARDISMRVRGWIDRVDDLSGLNPSEADWIDTGDLKAVLNPILSEIGRTYTPVMIANAKAVMAGGKAFETEVDGAPWTQPTFKYQAKTLGWIRAAYFELSSDDQKQVDDILIGTGCEALLPAQ